MRRKIGASIVIAIGAAAGCLGIAANAGAARTVKVTERVQLTLVKKTGTRYQHKGRATGTIGGGVTSRIRLDSLSIDGTVTINAKGGSLNIRIRGTARSGGLNAKFDGTATMAGGTGRYAKARGSGRFSGIVNRRTWSATINANGSLSY